MRNKFSLHPTFTHGSTLGLYELLTGKPCICDMITDSVVLSFFIEHDKFLSVLRSDPSVEDFLWQVLLLTAELCFCSTIVMDPDSLSNVKW